MTNDHRLEARNLTLAYEDFIVSENLDVSVPAGQITSIIGANGCGKSTLLRALSRLLSPRSGEVLLDGKSIHSYPRKQFAQILGLLPQSPLAPEGIVVSDLVAYGRQPYLGFFGRHSAADDAAVIEAMEHTGVVELADRPVDELSGGQRQRVWIAMILAQQTDILLLDEPTTFLDISNQMDVLDVIEARNRAAGTTVVMVLHDMNLAARYSDHIIAMTDGAVHAHGSPEQVATPETIREVFSIDSTVQPDPTTGRPHIFPIGRASSAHVD